MKKHSVGRRLQRRYAALGRSYSCLLVQNPSFTKSAAVMTGSEISHVLKEGELEKRSDNLLQFWKRKTCVLTTDSLNIYTDNQKKNKSKELKLQSIKKVDCVERTGKFVYFTIVTTDNKEIDFRCPGEENCWNAVITRMFIFNILRALKCFRVVIITLFKGYKITSLGCPKNVVKTFHKHYFTLRMFCLKIYITLLRRTAHDVRKNK
uniref:Pleckstrin homology-like domain family A member 2 n=1 Tax=Cyprinus carpio carpio TaxID=630221 RepID=A0A9J8DCL5_CYPCA